MTTKGGKERERRVPRRFRIVCLWQFQVRQKEACMKKRKLVCYFWKLVHPLYDAGEVTARVRYKSMKRQTLCLHLSTTCAYPYQPRLLEKLRITTDNNVTSQWFLCFQTERGNQLSITSLRERSYTES